jgi:hypothetical protein
LQHQAEQITYRREELYPPIDEVMQGASDPIYNQEENLSWIEHRRLKRYEKQQAKDDAKTKKDEQKLREKQQKEEHRHHKSVSYINKEIDRSD